MIKRDAWKKLKKKLEKLPAEVRVRELKVILVQATDKRVLEEAKELLDKAKVEAAAIPWRERNGILTISSRLILPDIEEGAVRPKEPELQDIVADIQTSKEEEPDMDYSNKSDDYTAKGYFSEEYKDPGKTASNMHEQTRNAALSRKKTWNEKFSDSTYVEKVSN